MTNPSQISTNVELDLGKASQDWQSWLKELERLYPTMQKQQEGLREFSNAIKAMGQRTKDNAKAFDEARKYVRGLTQVYRENAKQLVALQKQQTDSVKRQAESSNPFGG